MADSVSYPPPDLSGYMTIASANGTIAAMNARIDADDAAIAALQANVGSMKSLTLVGTATVGETTLLSLALGVKRYTGTMPGLAVGDRIIAFLTGAPGTSSLQDIYVSAANTYNVGLLNPALGVGAVIAVPIAIYKVT